MQTRFAPLFFTLNYNWALLFSTNREQRSLLTTFDTGCIFLSLFFSDFLLFYFFTVCSESSKVVRKPLIVVRVKYLCSMYRSLERTWLVVHTFRAQRQYTTPSHVSVLFPLVLFDSIFKGQKRFSFHFV